MDIIWGKQMPGHGCLCCCCFCDAGGGWFLVGGGLLVCRGGDPPPLLPLLPEPPSSTFLVKQHLPFPGQETLLSISSQRRVKNPETQVPRQPTKPPSFFASVFGAVVVVRFVVVVVDFVVGVAVVGADGDALDGDTSSINVIGRSFYNSQNSYIT